MRDLEFSITILSTSDVTRVDNLGKPHRATLGFLPEKALRDIIERGWGMGAFAPNGDLAGYIIFARRQDFIRVTQLCVADAYCGKGIARLLINALKKSTTTQKLIKLSCRRDFPAHHMWKKLGFIPLEERPGRSAARHPLTVWCYRLSNDDELGLWKAETSDETLDVVIDAQIFFDFDPDEQETHNSLISKGLLNDFLVDSLNFWITDEIFLEIDRKKETTQRQRSLTRARGFYCIEHDHSVFDTYKTSLQSVLPYSTDSEKSDLHHLAKTAASKIAVFVTKDENLLKRAESLKEQCGLSVFHPIELITSIHEELDRQSYAPSRVSGFRLRWRRAKDSDIGQLCENPFRNSCETKGKLREQVRSFLANPERFRSEVLESDGFVVAFRILDLSDNGFLRVPLARVSRSPEFDLFGSFLIADLLAVSVNEKREILEILGSGVSASLKPTLIKMGFIQTDANFSRVSLARYETRETATARVLGYAPAVATILEEQDDLTFERNCAPLVSVQDLPCYLGPIRPAFAMGLLDRDQSADDLFGGDPTILLRWENVYYRAKNRHKMLKAPGRILWYVSGKVGEIVAISHLDEVECGMPKELFRRYRKFGILEWRDIFKMCNEDLNKEIMALKFSLTFMFQNRVSLKEMRTIFNEVGVKESLQAPSPPLPNSALRKIFEIGYPL